MYMQKQSRSVGIMKGEMRGSGVKFKHVMLLFTLIGAIFMAGCITPETEQSEENLSVSELLENSAYDTEMTVYGRVSLLGELLCPCFELTSGGEPVQVWYGLMVEDDGTERPAVSVAGIENGDLVLVTGELKIAGTHHSRNDFWARSIEKIENFEDYGISPASEFNEVTEAESKEIARAFVENSPTYQFDGFDLEYKQAITLRCPYCWLFIFDFQSRQAGYGNRTGQMLAQVITPHTASVIVEQSTVPLQRLMVRGTCSHKHLSRTMSTLLKVLHTKLQRITCSIWMTTRITTATISKSPTLFRHDAQAAGTSNSSFT
jgi:hypothetical protein